jgi:hypothetical protein
MPSAQGLTALTGSSHISCHETVRNLLVLVGALKVHEVVHHRGSQAKRCHASAASPDRLTVPRHHRRHQHRARRHEHLERSQPGSYCDTRHALPQHLERSASLNTPDMRHALCRTVLDAAGTYKRSPTQTPTAVQLRSDGIFRPRGSGSRWQMGGRGRITSVLIIPIGYTWSYLACRIGHYVPIWQPILQLAPLGPPSPPRP